MGALIGAMSAADEYEYGMDDESLARTFGGQVKK